MIVGRILLNQPILAIPLGIIAVCFAAAIVWSYFRSATDGLTRTICAIAKFAGFALLAWCLLEPLLQQITPRQGANLMLVVSDNSQSLAIHDADAQESRGAQLSMLLNQESSWRKRLEQDYDVRRFQFDAQLSRVENFQKLDYTGRSSALFQTLETLQSRFKDRPVAGLLLLTDGNATDAKPEQLSATQFKGFPPIYPVLISEGKVADDIAVKNITVTESNFEAAPVTVRAEISSSHGALDQVVAELIDSSGAIIQQQQVQLPADQSSAFVRFQFQPLNPGIDFYRLVVAQADELEKLKQGKATAEPTTANNDRQVMVNRRRGPFRVLYVSGRPNWEYKYLHRAVQDDEEVELVGLLRIAKKEPKFDFRSRIDESTNPLFRGFEPEEEMAEQYDEPVIVRLGTRDDQELRDGFPKTAEELFQYQAIILDDVEAEFFRREQMDLIKLFVSRRGGGLLMTGGADSFADGNYRRTPIEELLPVYLEARDSNAPGSLLIDPAQQAETGRYVFTLSRDGWLESWMRLRKTEQEEKNRLAGMPRFSTVNPVGRLKPGAQLLATMIDTESGNELVPAVSVQSFGRGRCAAIAVGDFWRWGLQRADGADADLEPAWRQTVRWLVSDVLDPVQCVVEQDAAGDGQIELQVKVLNEEYLPLDNAEVNLEVVSPDGATIQLTAQPALQQSGVYTAQFTSRITGGYRARITAGGADGSQVGQCDAGWVFEPAENELANLTYNRPLLERLAQQTGGEMIDSDQLNAFVAGLANRDIPFKETKVSPLWHKWYVMVAALLLLLTEWGVRRVKGLP
jgi:hypothetical protein